MAYFAEPGCSECDRVSNILSVVEKRFPGLVVHELDIVDDLAINHCLSQAVGVPENQQHDAPAIFVGDDFLVDADIQLDPLIEILSKYADEGAGPVWTDCEQDGEVPPPAPWWAVILPGLIDGINPCAFATIVFFVSYLSLIERKGRDILIVGLAFTVAVFMSYLGFGIVLRQVLSGIIGWVGPVLKPILNILTAVICIVLAILSFGDFDKARRGKTKGMALRLPDKLRRWINATIRQSMKAGTLDRLVVASFVAGVIVSFVELTCTGQVYAPIILGLSNPEYQGQALLSLVVYCLAFVVPLIVVFLVSYFGTSSQQLGQVLQRNTARVKLITAILFVAISLWLVYDVLRTWGTVASILS
jgi:cytochrome c biogenesis protein CcdA